MEGHNGGHNLWNLGVSVNEADHPTEEKAIGEAPGDERPSTFETREEKKQHFSRMRMDRYRMKRAATLLTERELRRRLGLSLAFVGDEVSERLERVLTQKKRLLRSTSALANQFSALSLETGQEGEGEGEGEEGKQQLVSGSSSGAPGENSNEEPTPSEMEITISSPTSNA